MKLIQVNQNEAGQRLDKLLQKVLNKAPKSFLYKMLRKKNIVLNGKKADGSEKVNLGDEIKLFLSDETFASFSEVAESTIVEHDLDIIYEDNHVLFINKPLGMLSQKAAKDDVSMVEHVISYLLDTKQLNKEQLQSFKPGICNRLDRNTSGLMIAGKSLLGLQKMNELLKERTMDKYYLTIVRGNLRDTKKIEGYLSKDEHKNKVTIHQTQAEESEYICTEYIPLAHGRLGIKSMREGREQAVEVTLVRVKLITGKSHQIRAHLASIGHPLIGDGKYGDKKINDYFKKVYGLNHQFLHSYEMVLPNIEGDLQSLSQKIVKAPLPSLFTKIKKDLFKV